MSTAGARVDFPLFLECEHHKMILQPKNRKINTTCALWASGHVYFVLFSPFLDLFIGKSMLFKRFLFIGEQPRCVWVYKSIRHERTWKISNKLFNKLAIVLIYCNIVANLFTIAYIHSNTFARYTTDAHKINTFKNLLEIYFSVWSSITRWTSSSMPYVLRLMITNWRQ